MQTQYRSENGKMCERGENCTNFQFGRWLSNPPPGEEVVITGMSGRFPESRNVYEFRDNLFKKKDMVTSDGKRWILDHPEIPQRGGTIPDIEKFDPGHFGVHHRQAQIMDPIIRTFMEVAVEAVMDAGVHPSELEGSKTGVFVGYSFSDVETETLQNISETQRFGLTGYLRSMVPHRISYHLKLKGPSCIVDAACSSSLNALEHAFRAIRGGLCDSALVGGTHLTMHPGCTLQFFRLGVLSSDGTCKVFDQSAGGYVRSETIGCIFLQKARNSRRIYAQVIYSKINADGFKEEGMMFPSTTMQTQLLKEVYEDSAIEPSDLSYLEAHGTSTKVGDPQEIQAIDNALAKRRDKSLWIGSVKSNIGHGEPSSAIASIIKVLIAMESGYVAPNLHFKRTKEGLEGIEEGRIKVITEIIPLEGDRSLVGISNFGFGGNNCHAVVRRLNKKKNNGGEPEDGVPRLVCVSGRTKESVLRILDDVKGRRLDVEYIGLLHQLFKRSIDSHLHRGYTIISKNKAVVTSEQKSELCPPLCIIFDNFEKCFRFVGRSFLEFPVFKATLMKINKILLSKNINLIDALQRNKIGNEDNILGMVAVQIGIADLLKALELKATRVYGKFISEYFNENRTLEQTILMACQPQNKNHLNGCVYEKFSTLLTISDDLFFSQDPILTFLEAIGSLYEQGYNPQIHKLYPEVQYPVSRGTPMISPLIQWNHDKDWYTYKFTKFVDAKETKRLLSLQDEETKYVQGHVIDGRNLFPATGYLNLVWETFAENKRLQPTHFPVVFENCKFIRATTMPKSGYLSFMITLQKGSGNFEVLESDSVVVSGRIYSPEEVNLPELSGRELNKDDPVMEQDEIYKELHLRGYNYSGLFKGLVKCNVNASTALVKWENNWVSFMDNMLQMQILQLDTRLLNVPVAIKKLTIDPVTHLGLVNEGELIPMHVCKESNTVRSGGIQIDGLQASAVTRRRPLQEAVLEKCEFVPNNAILSLFQSLRVNMQILLEESLENNVKAVEIIDESTRSDSPILLPLINRVLEDIPLVSPDLTISTKTILEDSPGVKIEPVVLTPASDLLLIVATDILQRPTLLKQVLSALNKNGFVLTRQEKKFSPAATVEIEILTEHTVDDEKLILFRKANQAKSTKFVEVSSQSFGWISEAQKLFKSELDVVVYSQHRRSDGIIGLVNCLRREPGGNKIKCFFIADDAPEFNPVIPFYRGQIQKNQTMNVYKYGKWGTYRHLLLEDIEQVEREHSYVSVTVRGDLSSMKWVEGPLTRDQDQSIVFTYYSAINFKDVMTASGRINAVTNRMNQESIEGFEFSGRDSSGNRVMGMLNNGALSTLIAPDVNFMWSVPSNWSLEEAATVPVVYSTVIYALLVRTTLRPGTSILIHSATGGIGIAALHVALHHGCDIFVTVGTQEKRDFLKKNFPQIPESHIGNSRDNSFEEMIKIQTHSRGVDIVLNSLAEEKLRASIRCLAHGGRFMEIGKFDMANDNSLSLLLLEKEASYHGVMLDTLFKESAEIKLGLARLVSDGIKDGYVKPLPSTVFNHDKVEAAFRYMTTGRHIGKVLVNIREEESEKIFRPPKRLAKAIPKFYCHPDKSYIIIGGLGGFGLELADWLVLRGAKKLILTSRSEIKTGYQTQRINTWKSYGVFVHANTINITTKQGCLDLVHEANCLSPVDGIFNLAVVLDDALFEDQTEKKFRISLAPKALATKYLDEVTRELCPELRHFVIFSSVSCGRGNVGQTNYGMANSVMERICEKRKQDGFAALAIQWGAIGDVGLVAKMQKDNKELVIGGTLQQKLSSCLDVMDKFLKQGDAVVASMVVAEKLNKTYGTGSAVDAVANVLGIKDVKLVSHQSSLAELGMDSMMGTEVIQVLEKDFDIYISAKDVRSISFTRLIELEREKKGSSGEENENKRKQATNTMLKYIPDSKLGEASVVSLPSGVEDAQKAPTVFVLPGVEGVLKLLDPLTKNLNAHVQGVQYNYRNPEDSIQETATKLLPHIEGKLSRSEPFLLISYSFGVVVALEVASLLESKGFVGKIVAIDGSPEYSRRSMRQYAPGETEAELQTMMLYNILANFLPMDVLAQNKDKFVSCETFDGRIDLAHSLIPDDASSELKLERQAAVTLYKRFQAILKYRFANDKIKSPVKLFKAKYPMVKDMEHDYSLSQLCEQPVQVIVVEGDHMTVVEQEDLVKEINNMFT